MDPDAPPEKTRCMLVNPDVEDPDCVCEPLVAIKEEPPSHAEVTARQTVTFDDENLIGGMKSESREMGKVGSGLRDGSRSKELSKSKFKGSSLKQESKSKEMHKMSDDGDKSKFERMSRLGGVKEDDIENIEKLLDVHLLDVESDKNNDRSKEFKEFDDALIDGKKDKSEKGLRVTSAKIPSRRFSRKASRKFEIEDEYEEEGDYVETEEDGEGYDNEKFAMSDVSREEGEYLENYMRFYLEAGQPCPHLPASISSSDISCYEPILQRTIVIVKPEAMVYKDVILRAIFEAGFQILGRRVIHLTPEQVSEIYAKHYGSPSFPHLVISVSSGPVLVMSLASLDTISRWKKMTGPDGCVREEWFFPVSMRKRFGLQKTRGNLLYGSNNIKESNRDNRYFFSENILEPLIRDQYEVADYCNQHINPILLVGLSEVVKKRPTDPVIFLADWLLRNNPYQPRTPYAITLTPT